MSVLGVWMWPQSVLRSCAPDLVERCARAGVTDIYFLSKGLAGTASYQSALVPGSGRDLLGELLESAHNRGIRVHAWLTSANDEHYKQLHPESGRYHYVRGRDKGLISLTDEGYLAYMEKVVGELCRNYEIDGLHLDYIRYNHLLYGWSDEDLARYVDAGADTVRLHELMDRTFHSDSPDPEFIFDAFRTGDPSAIALAHVRQNDVTCFAQRLTESARAESKNLVLSAALMPEGAYEDTTFADLHYGQSYSVAAGLYDYALPMSYSKAYEKDSQWVRRVAEGTLKKGLRTIAGLHAYEGATCESLIQDIDAVKDMPVDGICLFRDGAFAMAFTEGRELAIVNTLDQPITGIIAGSDDPITPENAILPGEERHFRLFGTPDTVRVFTGTSEACVFLKHTDCQ